MLIYYAQWKKPILLLKHIEYMHTSEILKNRAFDYDNKLWK